MSGFGVKGVLCFDVAYVCIVCVMDMGWDGRFMTCCLG